jgi:glycosyltransferase involved in cell wall biosynthesis
MPLPTRSLKILTVTHNYPRFIGDPAGAFVARIAEGIISLGHQVEVVAPHAPGTAVDEEVGGVRVHRFRYAPEFLERVAYTGGLHQSTLGSPLAALSFPGFVLGFSSAVRRAVRQMAPDLIHAHWWLPGGWFASRSQVPFVVTCHGSDVGLLGWSSAFRLLATTVFGRAARTTTVSAFLARDIGRWLPEQTGHVTVTPMPVDVEAFLQGSGAVKVGPPQILYAGNLVPSKGVDVLLRAAAELTHRGVPYQLKILGQGPSQASLEALAHDLGIESSTTWSPFVPQTAMPAEYGASTVVVLPTRGQAEGLGLTLVEALLAGAAVVGTPAGGIPEVVRHEETGLLAREGTPADLADQLQRLLTDASLRARLSRAGREHVLAMYSPRTTIGRFLEIYRDVARD